MQDRAAFAWQANKHLVVSGDAKHASPWDDHWVDSAMGYRRKDMQQTLARTGMGRYRGIQLERRATDASGWRGGRTGHILRPQAGGVDRKANTTPEQGTRVAVEPRW